MTNLRKAYYKDDMEKLEHAFASLKSCTHQERS